MKKILLFLGITFLIFFISNCEYFRLMSQKEWMEKSGIEADDVVIYIGGGYDIGTALKPCYWKITEKNQEKICLEYDASDSAVNSIYVVSDTVYTCGVNNGGNDACYWIKKKKYNLAETAGAASVAYGINVKNGNIYTAGWENAAGDYNALYWENEYLNGLDFESTNTVAECLFVQQESSSSPCKYIGGREVNLPVYWKDGEINYLDGNSADTLVVRSIYVIGDTIYTCGQNITTTEACFWKNERLTYLPIIASSADAFSLFVSNDDIYIAGFNTSGGNQIACYWENGNYISLPTTGSGNSYAFSIFIFNENIYISGTDNNSACYWINEEQFILESNSTGNSIFVKYYNKK